MTIRIGVILLPLIAPAVLLPLAACDKAQIETAIASIKGDPIPQEQYALTTLAASSSEELVQAAVVIEPSSSSSEICETHIWRAWVYDCFGNNIGDAP